MNQETFDPFRPEENKGEETGRSTQPQGTQGGYFAPESNTPAGGYYQPTQQPKATPGMATASLVMGILSLLCCGASLFSILAMVFAFIAPKNEQGMMYGSAKGGLICGIIGLVLGILFGVVYAVLVVLSGGYAYY